MNVILIPVQGDRGSDIRQRLATLQCSVLLLRGVEPVATNTEIFSLSPTPQIPRNFIHGVRSFRPEIGRFNLHEIDIERISENDLPADVTRRIKLGLGRLAQRARRELIWVPVYSKHLPSAIIAVRYVFAHLVEAAPDTTFTSGVVLHFNTHCGRTIERYQYTHCS